MSVVATRELAPTSEAARMEAECACAWYPIHTNFKEIQDKIAGEGGQKSLGLRTRIPLVEKKSFAAREWGRRVCYE